VFFLDATQIEPRRVIKVVVHILLENRLSPLRISLDVLILHPILFNSLHLVFMDNLLQASALFFDLGDLRFVSIEYRLVALVNVFLYALPFIVELHAVCILDPLAPNVHCVNHVQLFALELVDVGDEALPPCQVADPFVRQLLFLAELHYPRIKQFLLFQGLLLFVNCLHHVSLSLTSDNGEA
jgi:hypothetical protein